MPNIFSYVLVYDAGFAPNPFGGFLTLAACKPQIRRAARSGDWLLGTGSTTNVGNDRVIYAAEIRDVIPLDVYGSDPAFDIKVPRASGEAWQRLGDNIYFREASDGAWKQRRNLYHREEQIRTDLSGENALVCRRYWYFGRNAALLPPELQSLVKRGPGHRKTSDAQSFTLFTSWLRSFRSGISGEPCLGAAA